MSPHNASGSPGWERMDQRIDAMRQRISSIHRRASGLPAQAYEPLEAAFQELSTGLIELQVADQELTRTRDELEIERMQHGCLPGQGSHRPSRPVDIDVQDMTIGQMNDAVRHVGNNRVVRDEDSQGAEFEVHSFDRFEHGDPGLYVERPGWFEQAEPPAREVIGAFARRAWRRPVTDEEVDRLMELFRRADERGDTFAASVRLAIKGVLVSPHFLFLAEPEPADTGVQRLADVPLASKLSYFLWSSMPDDELFRLARAGQLRKQLAAQTKRMLDDPKSDAFVRNFVGQWLQVRDIETIQIDARQVLAREATPAPDQDRRRQRFRELRNKEDDGLATPEEKEELQQLRSTLFRRFNREAGCAVLVVTHDPRLSERCDRTITLVDGRIVSDTVQNAASNPTSR